MRNSICRKGAAEKVRHKPNPVHPIEPLFLQVSILQMNCQFLTKA
jgi:hypothetical protein